MYSTDDKNIVKDNAHTLIAQNQCYTLLYIPHNNSLHFIIRGFWKNLALVPDYLPDLKKAKAAVKPGFKLLLDLSTLITHPQAVMSLHIEAFELLQGAGLSKSAFVCPTDRIARLQVEETLSQSHLLSKRFGTYEEAVAWLDQE